MQAFLKSALFNWSHEWNTE